MEGYEQKIYSCYCLFDVCLLAKGKNDILLSSIADRITCFMEKKYAKMVEKGMCSCKHCRPLKFGDKGIWILREINHEYQADIRYITCREYYNKKLREIFIGEFHEQKMNSLCAKKNLFAKSLGKFPCYYNFFLTGLIDSVSFCRGCKIFLCSLCDFQLEKVVCIT